jgi:hypothetical protein
MQIKHGLCEHRPTVTFKDPLAPDDLVDQLLVGVGDGKSSCANACAVARAAVRSSKGDVSRVLVHLAKCGSWGKHLANVDRCPYRCMSGPFETRSQNLGLCSSNSVDVFIEQHAPSTVRDAFHKERDLHTFAAAYLPSKLSVFYAPVRVNLGSGEVRSRGTILCEILD